MAQQMLYVPRRFHRRTDCTSPDKPQETANMAITALNSFADVQSLIAQVLIQNSQQGGVGFAPHGAFWNTLTYDQFVNGNVPNVPDPDTGDPIPILVKGSSAQSNLILALKGDGPLFADAAFGRMPANGPPFFSDDEIASIAAWIDNGCPE
jgi:hypothetical protein